MGDRDIFLVTSGNVIRLACSSLPCDCPKVPRTYDFYITYYSTVLNVCNTVLFLITSGRKIGTRFEHVQHSK